MIGIDGINWNGHLLGTLIETIPSIEQNIPLSCLVCGYHVE